ncbi:MAG: 2Fe-2S iron-sulfur cluster binding domain-containing protein [Sphingomonadales bacterium]|nr:2Fe-2S iron-sulfur cluster binding domain-containing protein [Sphingomonadales bacterium]NCO48055.1 2Fe-2S iron-sulfur cluster binding domain-containing protein [Sphingomonadales bacterium]NCO99625.1 2Fe-2S iron-sulfur cluster binding domain-containing protein [Sphingomonadales bacterium]NCP27188.1 2Fe-2S iron-sulfur cluster binding domain-containing protein [Sphingomonadales bacterium]NCP42093.1 2Fe-2S iron-sulfur cluster binding domain-containing protein [Sphingomonadales bacterium]
MKTITVHFVSSDGEQTVSATASEGDNLLTVAQIHDQPLEGTCEGQMACSTCHVIVEAADFAKLPEATEMEEDMLDLAAGARKTSRLACQITLTAALDGLTVHLPIESHNMQNL